MANPILFVSSILCGIVLFFFMDDLPQHSLTITIKGPFLYSVFFFGIITSIVNHGITSNIAKWLDRITMAITGSILLLFEKFQIWVLSISVIYFASKFCNDPIQTLLHCLVHMMACGLLVWLCRDLIRRPSSNGE